MMIMLVTSFFSWWYGAGWKQVAVSFRPRSQTVLYNFSVNQLLGTLFAPWRKIITYPGASFGDRLRAWGDNIVSRGVGFVVRLLVLLAAVLCLIAVMLETALELIVWPLLPVAVPALFIAGVLA
jgi:hypothetical protein